MFNAPNSTNATWTEERCEQLKALWAAGYSAGQIAAEMGCSKSAVIGKIHRMKLPQPVSKKAQLRRQTAVVPAKPKASPESLDEIYGPGLQVIHLTSENCHYPHGDPRVHGFEFCGAPAVPGLSWCAYHARRIYMQPT